MNGYECPCCWAFIATVAGERRPCLICKAGAETQKIVADRKRFAPAHRRNSKGVVE